MLLTSSIRRFRQQRSGQQGFRHRIRHQYADRYLHYVWLSLVISMVLVLLAWSRPATAQRLNVSGVAQQVYTTLPGLPAENGYVRAETGEVDEDNTLISRLIRYHLYVARRLPTYRLDWKLTLADYLGVNTWMQANLYPGATDLRTNPRDGDIAAISQLNRAERDALVNALTEAFTNQDSSLPGYGIGY